MSIYKSEAGREKVLSAYQNILAGWPVENRRHRLPTSLGETFVIESGSAEAPPLVLLHGSLSNSFTWFGDVPLLSQRFRVLCVDLVGEAGLSAESRPRYETGAYQRWLGEVLDGLGVARCAIGGMSLGGWMALRFATAHPERVTHLALLCPGGLYMQRRDLLLRMVAQKLASLGNRKKALGGMLGEGAGDPAQAEGLRRAMDFILLINKEEKPRYQVLPVFGEDEITRLTMPILAVFGEEDMLLNAKASLARLSRIAPHAQTVMLPGVGHAVLGQAERMLGFLTGEV